MSRTNLAQSGVALLIAALLVGCTNSGGREASSNARVESCMLCHNGSSENNYGGPGLENPHPFVGADNLTCTACHGGNGQGEEKADSHVPAPPEIGPREQWVDDERAYFNRLTLTGIDKFPDYEVDGKTYSALDYLQFINPGDLRVVQDGRSCGQCHMGHVDVVSASPLATETGIFSGAMFATGMENAQGNTDYEDTAADLGFRAIQDGDFDAAIFGSVPFLEEFPVYSLRFPPEGVETIRNNPAYDVENLPTRADLAAAGNRLERGTPLANLYHEMIAFTCGDCHLGSAGANNRTGDYRSAGCTSCHMRYSTNGRSTSNDPNIDRDEPYDPDDIHESIRRFDRAELPHVRRHLIQSRARTLQSGEFVQGIDDYSCAGCHQGSNRTVMQYWGIRLDQNEDLRRGVQYPAMPLGGFLRTTNDPRLFGFEGREDRGNNREFNGRDHNQYILEEDYDNDDRDDTPPDIHYEAGMGCIDCHGSIDLHGGDAQNPGGGTISSRMEHAVAIQCESCHGNADGYADVVRGQTYDGVEADLAVDSKGNPLRHVVREADGNFYLYSRLTGARHYVPQTHDTIVNNEVLHPFSGRPIYSKKASFAMGRDDGLDSTGIGPQQGGEHTGFRHSDKMDCASCHSSWTNTCMGCHLEGEFGNEYSNITGERIVFDEEFAEFIYQSPVFFQLGVNSRNKITQLSSNTKVFFRWKDRRNNRTDVFAFNDRKGQGNNADPGIYGALGHNALMAHSIRGRVDDDNEGPRYCVACHMTQDGLDQYGELYDAFRDMIANDRYEDLVNEVHPDLNFDTLALHFGLNPGNRLNSPLWVHMVAGLGTGLFLFDENGYPINNLDFDDNRFGNNDVNDQSPADIFDNATFTGRIVYNLDRIVDGNGRNSSGNHAIIPGTGPSQRAGTENENMAGPLTAAMIDRLVNPNSLARIVLTSYLDANGDPHGGAVDLVSEEEEEEEE